MGGACVRSGATRATSPGKNAPGQGRRPNNPDESVAPLVGTPASHAPLSEPPEQTSQEAGERSTTPLAAKETSEEIPKQLWQLLDIFNVCPAQVELACQALSAAKGSEGLQAQAHAVAVAVAKSQDEAAALKSRVFDNLNRVGTVPTEVAEMIKRVSQLMPSWQFDGTGRVDNPPTIPAAEQQQEQLRLGLWEVAALRHLAFCTFPAENNDGKRILALENQIFNQKPTGFQEPVALLTVGPPGSGKSRLMYTSIRRVQRAPPPEDFVYIDPDYWISNLCQSNNQYRPLANFQNQMVFMRALDQRCPILFDGTGKDPLNTCGRIISRLKQLRYRIHISIVLAGFECCCRRVRSRQKETGRGVPIAYVKSVFEALLESVPLYLQLHSTLGEEIYMYSNSSNSQEPILEHVLTSSSTSDEVELAVERAKELLKLDPAVISDALEQEKCAAP